MKHRKYGKSVLKALILGSLVTVSVPGVAGAATTDIGPVTVDGVVIEPSTEGTTTTVGKEGSTVSIGHYTEGYTYSSYLFGEQTVTIQGKEISTSSINPQSGTTLNIGGNTTDSVTIKGSGEEQWGGCGIMTLHNGNDSPSAPHTTIQAKNISISTDSSDWAAIWVQNNTDKNPAPENATSITLTGDTIDISAPTLGIVNYSNGQVNINGDLTLTAPIAISARGYSTTNINTDGKHSTVINGNIEFETPATKDDSKNSGHIINANVNLNLDGADSVWNGRAYAVYEEDGAEKEDEHLYGNGYVGSVNGPQLTMTDGATWNVTGNTIVDELKATDSTINVQPALTTMLSNTMNLDHSTLNLEGSSQTIKVESLSGTDATISTANLDNQVRVQKSTAANLTIHGTGAIADAIAKDSSNAQKLANVAVLSKADAAKARALSSESIASQITTDEGVIAGAYNLKVENGKVDMAKSIYTPNTTNVGIASMAAMNLMTWRQENNDLNKRLGELRDSDGENGIWTRMARGEAKYGARNMKNQYNYYQLGYDRKVGGNWTVGAAYSRTDGTTTFRRGTSDNDHNGFAVYGSYLGNDGSFVDLIGKYVRMDTDYRVNGGVGDGSYDADGCSFSAEYGKRFHGQQGFWLEPQAELTYGRVGAVDYTSARGAQIHHASMDSLVARLGFAAGKDIKDGHLYLRASYLYDFDGDTDVTMRYNGLQESYTDDIGGGWWEVGLGANLNLSEVTHFYMDVEKTYGGDIATPWQWNAGFRYSF